MNLELQILQRCALKSKHIDQLLTSIEEVDCLIEKLKVERKVVQQYRIKHRPSLGKFEDQFEEIFEF